MSDYIYYDGEPPKKRIRFVLISLLIVALAIIGVLIVQYILPQVQNDDQIAPTKMIVETVEPEETPQSTETVTKAITYIQNGDIPDIVEKISPAIVGVINYTETNDYTGFGLDTETKEVAQSSGSGVIISADGYIVTNNHVIDGASRVTVTLTNGEEYNAEIIGSDQYVDLAVLKINETKLDYMEFGDSKTTRAGELAIAIGYPLADDFSTITVTAGIISAVGKNLEVNGINFEMLQTDAPINPGNSGGALVDGAGQLIGINSSKIIYAGSTEYGTAISAEGMGFAIPSHVVEPIIEELIQEGEVIRPFMGIMGRIVSSADSEYYNIPRGMYIDEVIENGPSQAAGILVGDIILEADGVSIEEFQDLFSAINSHEVGDEMKVKIYRGETEETLEITVVLGSSKDY